MVERRHAATSDRRLMHEPPFDGRTGSVNTPADTATSHAGALHPNDQLGSVKLPKGGGAIRGLDEKFSVNPSTGTATLTLPIAVSPGRSGLGPQLALSYDSGAGNGPFGFGWSLGLPAITRKTDKGLPRYLDVDESDVFILSGAEDLVPVLNHAGNRLHCKHHARSMAFATSSHPTARASRACSLESSAGPRSIAASRTGDRSHATM